MSEPLIWFMVAIKVVSAMITPTRQPVMRKFLEKLLRVIVRSSMPGSVRSGI